MYLPRNFASVPLPSTVLRNMTSSFDAPYAADASSNQWSPTAIYGLILGVLALAVAVPGCVHGIRAHRDRSAS